MAKTNVCFRDVQNYHSSLSGGVVNMFHSGTPGRKVTSHARMRTHAHTLTGAPEAGADYPEVVGSARKHPQWAG